MESSPVREDVRFGEVFSTPTGNHRKRTNLVLNINNAGVEQVVGQYEEKLTPAKEIETAAERTRRKTANQGSKRSGIPSRRRDILMCLVLRTIFSFLLACAISGAPFGGVREKDMGEANEGAAELARCVDLSIFVC